MPNLYVQCLYVQLGLHQAMYRCSKTPFLCTASLSCRSRLPPLWHCSVQALKWNHHDGGCTQRRIHSTVPMLEAVGLERNCSAPRAPASQLTGCYVRHRYIMLRLGELYNVDFCLDPKPVQGDWNGTGGHCNFSTTATRTAPNGFNVIKEHCEKLRKRHALHMAAYGEGMLPSHMHSRDRCV